MELNTFLAAGFGPGAILFLIYVFAGGCVYLALVAEINRRSPAGELPGKTFGLPEAVLAAALIGFLLLNISASASRPSLQFSTRSLVENLLFTLAILLFIVTFLQFRGFNVGALGGLARMNVTRAIGIGMVLLFFAYPLVGLTELVVQQLFDGEPSRQNIVEMFSNSRTLRERMIIIFFAVVIAPVVEEFLFRFFIYGVLRRYFGRVIGTTANALLFAAAHTHLPSFAPLFVLGACFTVAYEWSGSILVAMTMHSVFNSVSLVALAFPELLSP